jgi:hypothetical protein
MEVLREVPENQRLQCLQAVEDRICSDCGSFKLRRIGNETVCMSCAVVQNNGHSLQHFMSDYGEQAQGSPMTYLAFGKNLGHTLGAAPQSRKDFFEVLAKAPGGTEDIGLRVRFMKVMSSLNEPAAIHRMIEVGSSLCREFCMEGDDALLFADHLGKLLRKVGTAAILQKSNGEALWAKKLAVATFVFVWQLLERDRGLRKKIEFQSTFPGERDLFKLVKSKYEVDRQSWDFVLWVASERLFANLGC